MLLNDSPLGTFHADLNRPVPAFRCFKESLRLAKSAADPRVEALALVMLGQWWHANSEPQRALLEYTQALGIESGLTGTEKQVVKEWRCLAQKASDSKRATRRLDLEDIRAEWVLEIASMGVGCLEAMHQRTNELFTKLLAAEGHEERFSLLITALEDLQKIVQADVAAMTDREDLRILRRFFKSTQVNFGGLVQE
jgi:hypothetical protein